MKDPHAPPRPYRGVGLIPPAGAARTWGLTVSGLPLLLILGVGLGQAWATPDGGSGTVGASGYSAAPWPTSPGAPVTSDTPSDSEPPDSSSYSGPVWTDPSPTPTDTPTATDSASSDPRAVVSAYFAAINNRNYRTAWELGGKHLDSDYEHFVSGYATTQHAAITVVYVQESRVRITIDALQTDGTSRSYDATYTVRDGEITDGTATQTS
ncbi:hypothetical protein [Streptomyces sp. NPDC086787]|uniref:hypothetical protein n=1 Tax=Streptomyces sp. NPDC086787 TaxID=3365759 RepID=UPI0037F87D9A